MESVKAASQAANIAVLSDAAQLGGFLTLHPEPRKEFAIYCDNDSFYDELSARGIPFKELDEFRLRREWEEVNSWGCNAVLSWMRLCRDRALFADVDLPSVFYLFFTHLLVQGVKNYGYSQALLSSAPFSSVTVFRSADLPVYPKFSGNAFLNYFIEETAKKRQLSIERIDVPRANHRAVGARINVSGLAKRIGFDLYAFFRKNMGGVCVYGSLAHLGSTAKELVRRKTPFFFYSDQVIGEQLLFCLRRGIPYAIEGQFSPKSSVSGDSVGWKIRLLDSLKLAESVGIFNYKDYDFGPFIRNMIFSTIDDQLRVLAKRKSVYGILTERLSVAAFLLDEDYALRGGFMACYARSKKIPTFCVSHANTAVDFSVRADNRVFGQSTTFVNSEHEKRMFMSRGWDPDRFEITGTPRYDPLIKAEACRVRRGTQKKIRLLYCANSTVSEKHSPDQHGYLGHGIYSFRVLTQISAEAIFRAAEGLSIEILLKPHNLEGLASWERFVRQLKTSADITFMRKKGSILNYFSSCDAMVLSYWSTAITESAICGVPTIFVDLKKIQRPSLAEYAGQGLCKIAQTQEELRKLFEDMCFHRETFFGAVDPGPRDHYLGRRDGKASERVADFIVDHLGAGHES